MGTLSQSLSLFSSHSLSIRQLDFVSQSVRLRQLVSQTLSVSQSDLLSQLSRLYQLAIQTLSVSHSTSSVSQSDFSDSQSDVVRQPVSATHFQSETFRLTRITIYVPFQTASKKHFVIFYFNFTFYPTSKAEQKVKSCLLSSCKC